MKPFFLTGCIFAALAVLLGAFAAHTLPSHLGPGQINSFKTGVEYQFIHSIALCILAWVSKGTNSRLLKISGWCFILGILCFSWSIYLLVLKDVLGIASWTWLGPITPIGGLLFVAGWILFGNGGFRKF